jgi:hypothetical protein
MVEAMKMNRQSLGVFMALALVLLGFGIAAGQDDEIPDVLHMPTAVGDVEFPHLLHIEDIEVECAECHHETKAAELDMPHEHFFDDFWIQCQTCHVPGGEPMQEQACSKCHLRNHDNFSDETLSAKAVIHKSCWECHEAGIGSDASAVCGDCHVRDQD